MPPNVYGSENRIITPAEVADEALFALYDQLVWIHLLDHRYQAMFKDKIGAEVDVKREYRAIVSEGRRLPARLPKIDRTVKVKINQRRAFAFDLQDEEMTLHLSNFRERYFMRAMEEIAYSYNQYGADVVGQGLYFYNGNPGSAMTPQAPRRSAPTPPASRSPKTAITSPCSIRRTSRPYPAKSRDWPAARMTWSPRPFARAFTG